MNQQSSTDLSVSSNVSPDTISRRAYELWEAEGRPEGCDLRHWLQAEQELSGRDVKNNLSGNTAQVPAPSGNSDVTPLQGTRAAAAVTASASRESGSRENGGAKRGASPAMSAQDRNGNSSAQNATKRKPATAPAL